MPGVQPRAIARRNEKALHARKALRCLCEPCLARGLRMEDQPVLSDVNGDGQREHHGYCDDDPLHRADQEATRPVAWSTTSRIRARESAFESQSAMPWRRGSTTPASSLVSPASMMTGVFRR